MALFVQPQVQLSQHARQRAAERGFLESQIIEAVCHPDFTYPDVPRPGRERATIFRRRFGSCTLEVRAVPLACPGHWEVVTLIDPFASKR